MDSQCKHDVTSTGEHTVSKATKWVTDSDSVSCVSLVKIKSRRDAVKIYLFQVYTRMQHFKNKNSKNFLLLLSRATLWLSTGLPQIV